MNYLHPSPVGLETKTSSSNLAKRYCVEKVEDARSGLKFPYPAVPVIPVAPRGHGFRSAGEPLARGNDGPCRCSTHEKAARPTNGQSGQTKYELPLHLLTTAKDDRKPAGLPPAVLAPLEQRSARLVASPSNARYVEYVPPGSAEQEYL